MCGISNGSATCAAGCFSTSIRRSLRGSGTGPSPEDAAVRTVFRPPVAVELIETPSRRKRLVPRDRTLPQLGCLIVIDDSARDTRISTDPAAEPDIVKIDREMTRRVRSSRSRGACSQGSSGAARGRAAGMRGGHRDRGGGACAIDAHRTLCGRLFLRPAVRGCRRRRVSRDVRPADRRSTVRMSPNSRSASTPGSCPTWPHSRTRCRTLPGANSSRPCRPAQTPSAQRCSLIAATDCRSAQRRPRATFTLTTRASSVQPTEGTDWQTKTTSAARSRLLKGQIRALPVVTGAQDLRNPFRFAFEASDGSQQVLCLDLRFCALPARTSRSGQHLLGKTRRRRENRRTIAPQSNNNKEGR